MNYLKLFLPKKKRWTVSVGEMQRNAYLLGCGVGLAGLYWIYLLLLAVPALRFVTGPDKPFKVLASMIFGVITPFWLYLPYYLYNTYFNI